MQRRMVVGPFAATALVVAALLVVANALVALKTSNDVTRAEAEVTAGMNAHERALVADREAELRAAQRIDRWTTYASLVSGLAFVGSVGLLLARRARADGIAATAVEQARHAERLATVGRLAAGIAHELGTPLSVAAGHAEMIAAGEVTGERAMKSARIIGTQLERVTSIVRQLLDFSRRRSTETTAVDACDAARRTVELLRSAASKRGIELVVHAEAAPLSVLAAEDAVPQVLTNLVMNAIHASRDGGEVAVDVTTARDGDVLMSVRDHGTGMPPEVRDHLFDPFFTTKALGEGTGLGLSVVHGIVHDHHGTIEVDSAPGRGTTMTVHWPRA